MIRSYSFLGVIIPRLLSISVLFKILPSLMNIEHLTINQVIKISDLSIDYQGK